jgi:hypothetical protein
MKITMRPIRKLLFVCSLSCHCISLTVAQVNGDFSIVRAEIDFNNRIRQWDGFGFNYVQTSMTPDYETWAQDYGGFSILSEEKRREIIELVFGDEGLKPGVIKMFLDPLHQETPYSGFNHEKTTGWMVDFVKRGLRKTEERGDSLKVLTTLYSPPAWATVQKEIRGRDLDPEMKEPLVFYMVAWVNWLKKEGIPVKYLSLHNQGDKPYEFPSDGSSTLGYRTDYNAYWPPQQVVEFIKLTRRALDDKGLHDVGVTPGECSRWHYFDDYGYASAIAADPDAMASLGLITSHGFHKAPFSEWFGEQRSTGSDMLRALRPGLHAWVGSSSFLDMSATFAREVHGNIYTAKINAYIPWAGIQRPEHWLGEEWNPGTAIRVEEDGTYRILRGYYYLKQLSRAGQPGTAVAKTMVVDKYVKAIAFASDGSGNPDAFVIINLWEDQDKELGIEVKGAESVSFEAYRSNDAGSDKYRSIGDLPVEHRYSRYQAPARAVTTIFAK